MPTDMQAEIASEAKSTSKAEPRHEEAKATAAKHSSKPLPRRSLWTSFVDRVKEAFHEPEFALRDQRTGQRLMTRREMIGSTALLVSIGTLDAYHLRNIINALDSKSAREPKPKDYDPTPQEIKAVKDFIKLTEKPDGVWSPQEAETAKKYDLTLYDFRTIPEHCKKIFDDYRDYDHGRKEDLLDFDTYFDTAKEVLALYGVNLVLGEPGKEYECGGRPLTKEEKERPETKESILKLINSFFDQPVELVKQTGLKKVGLIQIAQAGGYAETYGTKDTYYVDPTQKRDDNPFDHEIYHLYDVNKGGNYFAIDEGFNNLNPSGFNYTDSGKKPKSTKYLSYMDDYIKTFDYLSSYAHANNPSLGSNGPEISATLQKQLDSAAAHVAVVDNYSFNHIVEDKANLGSILFNPGAYSFALDERKPILREKFIFLLARLYHDNPNLVKYFLEVRNQVKPYTSFSLPTHGSLNEDDFVTLYP